MCIIFSCSPVESYSQDSTGDQVNKFTITGVNSSDFRFENVIYNNVNFEDVGSGGKTTYKLFRNQYAYGSV